MSLETVHKSVLLHESIEGLNFQKGDVFVDATINGGGHSEEVAKRFSKDIKIIGIDLDADALRRAEERLTKAGADFTLVESSFRNVGKVLHDQGIPQANKMLFDLGLSSNQFEDSGRGFSFQKNEPLLMTFKKNPGEGDITAHQIVNEWDEEHIADVIYGYGEERYSRRIAKKIVERRQAGPLQTTDDLVQAIKEATPYAYQRGKTHYATKTFQALRIAANDEIQSLKDALTQGFSRLSSGGRMAFISFHSIEDRTVKVFFKEMAQKGLGVLITKKPITPTIEEVKENRRARSAKLRIIEKL